MLELFRRLLERKPEEFQQVLPLLRLIIHSPLLDRIVSATPNPVDNLVLQILRILVPKEQA